MFSQHTDHVVIYAGVTYKPVIGFGSKLPSIAELLLDKLKVKQWQMGNSHVVLRDLDDRLIFHVDHRRVLVQSLGIRPWVTRSDELFDLMGTSIKMMGATALLSASFRSVTFAQLSMRHDELFDLFFESFLPPRSSFSDLPGTLDDGSLQLYTTDHEKQVLRISVNPATADQAQTIFDSTPQLPLFVEPMMFDTTVKEFRDGIQRDCLVIESEVIQENCDTSALTRFFRQAITRSSATTQQLIDKLLSVKRSKGH